MADRRSRWARGQCASQSVAGFLLGVHRTLAARIAHTKEVSRVAGPRMGNGSLHQRELAGRSPPEYCAVTGRKVALPSISTTYTGPQGHKWTITPFPIGNRAVFGNCKTWRLLAHVDSWSIAESPALNLGSPALRVMDLSSEPGFKEARLALNRCPRIAWNTRVTAIVFR